MSEIDITENSDIAEVETELRVAVGLSHDSVQEDDGRDDHLVCSTVICSNVDISQVFP